MHSGLYLSVRGIVYNGVVADDVEAEFKSPPFSSRIIFDAAIRRRRRRPRRCTVELVVIGVASECDLLLMSNPRNNLSSFRVVRFRPRDVLAHRRPPRNVTFG